MVPELLLFQRDPCSSPGTYMVGYNQTDPFGFLGHCTHVVQYKNASKMLIHVMKTGNKLEVLLLKSKNAYVCVKLTFDLQHHKHKNKVLQEEGKALSKGKTKKSS